MPDVIQLAGGYATRDPRLDRIPEFDERSRAFPVLTLIELAQPVTQLWECNYWLDQGQVGACVGFSITTEGGAVPVVEDVTNDVAMALYKRAQQLDDQPGENYEGTSVLAGAKAATEKGWYTEYRWGFGVHDLAMAVSGFGPAVIGIWWHESMMQTDADGKLTVAGQKVGGHAICVRGYNAEEQYFTLRNSWGRTWGKDGDCHVSYSDMGSLLEDEGDCMIPVHRVLVPPTSGTPSAS